MKTTQYKLIRIKDSKVMGFLVGKLSDQFGNKFLIIDVVEMTA